ncbi:MAG TPA: VWA domain-containing protein [Thermopetrobacter sp.]|nr:VWA domain-containing protein [Thermopetrobacter sp.]
MKQLKTRLTRFAKRQDGAVAIFFGLAAIPVILLAGASIDMISTMRFKAQLQKASDAAVLAAAVRADLPKAQRIKLARRTFAANIGSAVPAKDFKVKIGKNTVTGDIKAKAGTMFMKMIGVNDMDVAAHAVANFGQNALELALVLDNTYSMHGSKIATLRRAAKNLVRTIHASATSSGASVKIGVVPFTRYVRLPKSWKGKWWLNAPSGRTWVARTCRWRTEWDWSKSNCRTVWRTCYRDGVGYRCKSTRCDWKRSNPRRVYRCSGGYWRSYTWTGCVGSRKDPLFVTDGGYATDKVPGLHNREGHGPNTCPKEIVPLIDVNKRGIGGLISTIGRMRADGDNTYIPGGLKWGWHMLSPNEPLKEAAPYGKIKKAIVLMSDGESTVYADGRQKYHKSGGGAKSRANAVLARLCTNIKKRKIHIYTVAFQITDPATRAAMKSCATDADSHFDASDNTALLAAFDSIARKLAQVYLSE